jgi:hypothetical protein
MASIWTGKSLTDKWVRKYGFRDEASKIRVIDWINDIARDMAIRGKFPSLKMKLKKSIAAGTKEIDLSPQIPAKPIIALAAGGSITDASVVSAKITFVIFDESGREINSIESEPSPASDSVTTANPDKSIDLSGIDTYDGLTLVKPNIIHRRIYLKVGDNPYYLAKTIENNTDTTATVDANPSSVVEPPEYSLVAYLSSENPIIENLGVYLNQAGLDLINQYDPNPSSSGTPYYYARIGKTNIQIYPAPNDEITLSYWIYKIPSRIVYDEVTPLQVDIALKELMEAGVTWKYYEDKDQDGQESKKNNYDMLLESKVGEFNRSNGQFGTVREVC